MMQNQPRKRNQIINLKKFLIIGLGNVGVKYANTRHNIGFDIADELALFLGAKFNTSRLADVCETSYKGKKIYIIKPSTYMNLSGRAFRLYANDLSIPIENTLTLVDELALPFGKIRLKPKGSHAGHNGLKNIQELMNTNQYPRLRFGIGNDFSRGRQADYVLSKWKAQEQEELPSYINDAVKATLSFVHAGIQITMNEFN